ncbi:unnamed protein product [Orchesella dallaii]|uniref:SCP domain-containing protein n=1 Tax=Orchesella dallaii TaxID=48710 RepID=A0ABP1RLR1_9HEXA
MRFPITPIIFIIALYIAGINGEQVPRKATGARWIGVEEHDFLRKSHQCSTTKGDNERLHRAGQRHAEYLASIVRLEALSLSQNLAEVWATREEEAVRKAVRRWYKEESYYDYNYPGFSKETQHYTRLIWNGSTHLGIGVAWNPVKKQFVVVANYDPNGNIYGKFNNNVKPQLRNAEPPIIFYEHQNYEGKELNMDIIGGFHNLPDDWVHKISSIKVEGECIVA